MFEPRKMCIRDSNTAPCVFHELGADVVSIGVQPNGLNINDHCGATSINALVSAVPVSYTHLDVYKRQQPDRGCGPAILTGFVVQN